MFTGFAHIAVALLTDVVSILPLDADADPPHLSHPLMVLAEPSTLALAIIGAGVMAVSHRVRRSKRRHSHSLQAMYAKKNTAQVGEQPKRGAA